MTTPRERDPRTYITVHDGMPEHPGIEGLSDAAFRALITLWCYSSKNLTDGHINDFAWRKRVVPKVRAELLDAGRAVMHESGDGVFMHDYLKHQRSAEEIKALRAARVRAGSIGGRRSAQVKAQEKKDDTKGAANG